MRSTATTMRRARSNAPLERSMALEYDFPEVGAGGFSHVSSSVDFYTRINALLQPEFVVMDFGAGRGGAAEQGSGSVHNLRILRGKTRKAIGVDVDPAIHLNPRLDEARVIDPVDPLPFNDGTFDIIYIYIIKFISITV
jgi:hypothetical protein